MRIAGLSAVLVSGLLLSCAASRDVVQPTVSASNEPPPVAESVPTAADADAFVAQLNAALEKKGRLWNAAAWLAATYINDDTQLLSSAATTEYLELMSRSIEAAKRFDGVGGLSPATARALKLIKLGSSLPAPKASAQREELAVLAAKLEANYGAGKWCRKDAAGNQRCLLLQEIEKIIDNTDFSHSPQEIAEAWVGWHATAKPIRDDYRRFVDLMNGGARDSGFADTGELWRSGYDMSGAEFEADVERLWGQVKPLYERLQCHVRGKLNRKYGDAVVPRDGLIPAHLLGNMWAQEWSNLYPLIEPYPGVADVNIGSTLQTMRDREYKSRAVAFKGKPKSTDLADMEHAADAAAARKMTAIAEDFYASLGMPKLPGSFWDRSLLVQPRDRDVVCHASAWDIDPESGDVRIKQCIEPSEEQLVTIHHELGHIYYYLNYKDQPSLFQRGAHDGFHEAIGDTVTLSLTPEHLKKVGLLKEAQNNERAVINSQMKLALDRIVLLPWSKLVDQWRWKVFSGEVKPDEYNAAWWRLRAEYQGVSPPVVRTEADFDPGAKFHIPGNTPYTRYFLARILQFQFQKALCDAAGFTGPLYQCDVYGSKAAGERFMAMLSAGGSQPWQDTLEKLTGTRQMDGSAMIEYFQPLMGYLEEKNRGMKCGW